MKNQEQQEPRQAAVQTASSEDQDYIYTPVPQNKRYGWIKMFFVWLCWNVVVPPEPPWAPVSIFVTR